jgi:hypothetical protein
VPASACCLEVDDRLRDDGAVAVLRLENRDLLAAVGDEG